MGEIIDIFKEKVFSCYSENFICHSERSEESNHEETLWLCLRVTVKDAVIPRNISDEESTPLLINSEIPPELDFIGMTIGNRANNA